MVLGELLTPATINLDLKSADQDAVLGELADQPVAVDIWVEPHDVYEPIDRLILRSTR